MFSYFAVSQSSTPILHLYGLFWGAVVQQQSNSPGIDSWLPWIVFMLYTYIHTYTHIHIYVFLLALSTPDSTERSVQHHQLFDSKHYNTMPFSLSLCLPLIIFSRPVSMKIFTTFASLGRGAASPQPRPAHLYLPVPAGRARGPSPRPQCPEARRHRSPEADADLLRARRGAGGRGGTGERGCPHGLIPADESLLTLPRLLLPGTKASALVRS